MKFTFFARSLLLSVLISRTMQPALCYQLYGLEDKTGKTIVPCQYVLINDVGHGLYLLEKPDASNPVKRTYSGVVVDNLGQEVPVTLPSGYTLTKIYLPDSLEQTAELTTIPAQSILKIHGPEGYGLADTKGRFLLEAKHEDIGEPIRGCFPINNWKKEEKLIFDASTGKCAKVPALWYLPPKTDLIPVQVSGNGLPKYGYIKLTGEMVIKPAFEEAEEFTENGLAKVRIQFTRTPPDLDVDDAFIDKTGKIVSPIYREAFAFNGKCASVCYSRSKPYKWGLVDSKFKYTVKAKYYIIFPALPDIFAAQESESSQLIAIGPDGNVLFRFPPNTGYIERVGDYIRCHIRDKASLSDSSTRKESVLYVDKTGKLADESVIAKPHGLILKIAESNHFTKAVWLDGGHKHFTNRNAEFAFLLKDYNLIKMSKADLTNLLGPAPEDETTKALTYNLYSGPCGNTWSGLKFEFDSDDKLVGWRLRWFGGRGEVDGDLITTNVIVDENYKGTNMGYRAAPLGFKEKPQ